MAVMETVPAMPPRTIVAPKVSSGYVRSLTQQEFRGGERGNSEFDSYIGRAYREVAVPAPEVKIPFKFAAYQIAVKRVAHAEELRGL